MSKGELHFLDFPIDACYNIMVICDNIVGRRMKTNYGEIIHNKRKTLNLTGEKLAEYSNMSTRHLRNIEKGITIPKLDTVIKIGKSLNMNLGDLGELKITEDVI